TLFAPIVSVGRLDDPPPHHDVEVYPDHAIFHSEPVRVEGRPVHQILGLVVHNRSTYAGFIQLYENLRMAMIRLVGVAPNRDFVAEVRMPRALFVPMVGGATIE